MQEKSNPLPKTIGDYQIERALGQGGMGEVFLAFDPVCKRHIALKQIRKDLSQNVSLQKRFYTRLQFLLVFRLLHSFLYVKEHYTS